MAAGCVTEAFQSRLYLPPHDLNVYKHYAYKVTIPVDILKYSLLETSHTLLILLMMQLKIFKNTHRILRFAWHMGEVPLD